MNLDKALQDLRFYKSQRVGRKHLSQIELWRGWINS